jgi:hypothetical protein
MVSGQASVAAGRLSRITDDRRDRLHRARFAAAPAPARVARAGDAAAGVGEDEGMSEWQAGRELDAEIARRVMGWTIREDHRPSYVFLPYTLIAPSGNIAGEGATAVQAWSHVPYFSTSVAAAWQVIRRFDNGAIAGIAPQGERIAFWQRLGHSVEWERNTQWPEALALHDLPLLICRAALAAVEAQQ